MVPLDGSTSIEHTEPRRESKIEEGIPGFAHHPRPWRLQFGLPGGGACSASIARLIRAHTTPLVVAPSRFKLGVGAVLSDQASWRRAKY